MNTIWMNITSMFIWKSTPVGIIRAETEIARYFLAQNMNNIRFCRYDIDIGYIPVSNEEVALIFNTDITAQHDDIVQTPITTHVYRRFFNCIRNNATKIKTKIINDNTQNNMMSSNKSIPFSAGDVYISLGIDWAYNDLKQLKKYKHSIGFNIILCCHDIIPVKFPHLNTIMMDDLDQYFIDIALAADEILCVSQCTLNDLKIFLNTYNIPIPIMTLLQWGNDIHCKKQYISENIQNIINERFIIFVSSIDRRKNHETLYKAYARLIDNGIYDIPKLLFVGAPGYRVADFMEDLRLDFRVKNYIKIIHNVNDNDLYWLYKHSLFTVFPSLYEGWGLPVAESLALEKFCLASNTSSIPEIGKDFIECIDPLDMPLWAERLQWYFTHPEEIEKAEERIKKYYTAPAWDDAGATVLNCAKKFISCS